MTARDASSSSSEDDSSSSSSNGSSLPHPEPRAGHGTWTTEEHERFLVATSLFPNGPWRAVAEYVGTRSMRQTMTHAQKLLQRQARHERGLKPPGRVPAPNAKPRRRKSRSRRALQTPPVVDIPIDEELELLFAPPPTQAPTMISIGSVVEGFEARFGDLDMTASGPARELHDIRGDQTENWVPGISTVGAWLDEFLRSVEISDLDQDDDDDEVDEEDA